MNSRRWVRSWRPSCQPRRYRRTRARADRSSRTRQPSGSQQPHSLRGQHRERDRHPDPPDPSAPAEPLRPAVRRPVGSTARSPGPDPTSARPRPVRGRRPRGSAAGRRRRRARWRGGVRRTERRRPVVLDRDTGTSTQDREHRRRPPEPRLDGSVEAVADEGAAVGRADQRDRRAGQWLGLRDHPHRGRPDPHQQPRGRGRGRRRRHAAASRSTTAPPPTATVLGTDSLTDTAVIQAQDVSGLTPATIGSSERARDRPGRRRRSARRSASSRR